MKFNTIDELLNYTKTIIGKSFKDFDIDNKLENGLNDKGILGKIVETGFYHYDNNNLAQADFNNLGVELKVTGYIKNKNGSISAKERLVLSKINYNDIINEDFNFSKLLFKNKKILIIWYEYDYTKNIRDFIITNYQLYDMSQDEFIIKNDFETIKEKVIEGKAHLLSEGDTSYLGACVKGLNGEEKVKQPNSSFDAKPRAFSLKHSYLTGILRNLDFALEVDNQEYKSVEEYVYAQIKKYIGKTQVDIYNAIFDKKMGDIIPKNIGKIISDRLIGTDDTLPEKNSLFLKTNYRIKNIPVDNNYMPLERMPFRTIRLSEFNKDWDDSDWKLFFEEITIIALCYEGKKEISNGFRVLKDLKKITFNSDDIESFGKSYNMVKEAIEKRDIKKLPYPNSYVNQYLEVAPKGKKGDNAYETFFEDDKTKVCFMLNKEFVHQKLLNDIDGTDNDVSEKKEVTTCALKPEQRNSIMNYNIFRLYDYDIPIATICELADKRISPYSIYINGISEIASLSISDNKKNKLISAIKKMIDNKDEKRSIYELLYKGITKSVCDNLIDKKINIELLRNTSPEKLKSDYDLGNVMSEKIKGIINRNDNIILESNNNINTIKLMEDKLIELTLNGPISLFTFKQKLSNDSRYKIDNFHKDYSQLQQEDKVIIGMYGISYNYTTIEKYISKKFDKRISKILIDRLNGKTLESIAQDYDITRERVRQICKKLKIDQIIESLAEDKYKDVFEKYNWNKKLFCDIFSEKEITYNYLDLKYIKGEEELNKILDDDFFSDEQKEIFKNHNGIIITSDGELISNSNDFMRKFLIKYASNEVEISELTELYNREIEKYPELEMRALSSRNLEARLNRCDYAFFSSNHKVRYFDFDSLSEESIEQLKELIIIDDGFYSTEYLFRNNEQLMHELDIRNECELHNILRLKIDDEENNVYFLRMPNFLVEYHDKDDFILDKIREYSPISINDFLDMLYDEYGHKKNTMMSYLTTYFDSYIKNGFFDLETVVLNEKEIELLKEKLNKDIYSVNEIKKIIENSGYEDSSEILTNRNLYKAGYRLRGSYAVKNEYGSIYGYFDNKIKNEMIIKIDDELSRIGAVYNTITHYCKNLKIFKIDDNIYMTSKKLESLGISEDYLLNFINNIRDVFSEKDYFSVYNVIDELDYSKFEELGLSEQFIESILFYLEDVNTLRINNNRLFSIAKNNMSISNFMNDMVDKYSSISLDDLEKEIMKNYQISVPFNKLREYLYNTDIFYSDIMGKIYSDKNIFYEEVYNE